jgi:hypothetical protein
MSEIQSEGVQTISDDEQGESIGQVKEIADSKRKSTGAAAHRVLKRAEGKRVRLSQQQLAEISLYAELVAVDAALPTEGEVKEAEEEESSDDDSIEPKLLTLKEARESAAQLAAFVQANQESRDLGPFADMMNALTIQLDRTVVTVRHHQAPVTQFFPVLSRDT